VLLAVTTPAHLHIFALFNIQPACKQIPPQLTSNPTVSAFPSKGEIPNPAMPASKLLPSLAHAVSGSAGSVVSTAATYPLDLVGTRLRAQRQLLASGDSTSGKQKGGEGEGKAYYDGVIDALRSIPKREGGVAALFAGLPADAAKSAADSFLFFLFYTWFRTRRLGSRGDSGRRHLGAAEELVVGAVAGACARAFTTPIANVVTRKQTASLVQTSDESAGDRSFRDVLAEIREEKGVVGLWAGYSAALVLTLNPSITFFLQQMLTKSFVPRQDWDDPAPGVTFALAAFSKAVATVVTYPFQIAKTRMQLSPPAEKEEEKKDDEEEEDLICMEDNVEKAEETPKKPVAKVARSLADETIFATVARIGKNEGAKALYDGMSSELLKAFFSHGITMVAKDIVHKLLFRLYFAILAYLRRHPGTKARLSRAASNVTEGLQGGYVRATAARGKEGARNILDSGETVVTRILDRGQRRLVNR